MKLPAPPAMRRPWFLFIAASFVAALAMLPLVYLLIRTAGAGASAWALLKRPMVWGVMGNSVLLALFTTLMGVALGVPLAWLTVRSDIPLKKFWTVAAIMPLAMPSYVMAYAFIALLGPTGMLAQWLRPLGVQRLPELYGLPGASLVIGLINYPFIVLSARAALQKLDPSLEEAARGLGLGRRQIIWRVLLPQLRPAIASGSLLVALYALSDFGAPAMLQCRTFTRVIFTEYTSTFDRTSAAVMALVLVALTVAILGAESLTRGRGKYHRSTPASQRPARPVQLGRWKWPSLLFCAFVFFVSVAVPVLVLLSWVYTGWINAAGRNWEFLQPRMVWNSSLAAFLAAIASVAAAFPVVLLAVRHRGRVVRLIDRLTFVGNALPGIVIALALVFFGANYAPRWLYQSLPLLIFAYVIRFLPQAVGCMRMSLLQVNPKIEEAGISLGRSRASVFFRITLPLLTPGILAGGALVFLTTIKELPITLLLHPTDFTTLVEEIWWTTSQVLYSRAAPPALLLVAVSALSIGLILRQERQGEYE